MSSWKCFGLFSLEFLAQTVFKVGCGDVKLIQIFVSFKKITLENASGLAFASQEAVCLSLAGHAPEVAVS